MKKRKKLLTARFVQTYTLNSKGGVTMMTLNQVAEITGMTRRVIQEYEKYGLSETPTERNKYGHLLYNEAQVERLWQIRFYRELGYDKKKIEEILCSPDFDRKKALETQIQLLTEKREKLDDLINVATVMRETGIGPKSIRRSILGIDTISYNDMFGMVSAFSRQLTSSENVDHGNDTENTDDAWLDELLVIIDKMAALHKKGLAFDCEEVNQKAEEIYHLFADNVSESIMMLSFMLLFFSSDSEMGVDFDEEYGVGSCQFCCDAIQKFCRDHIETGVDKTLFDTIANIVNYGINKYSPGSDEVQEEVEKLSNYMCSRAFLGSFYDAAEFDKVVQLRSSADLYETKGYSNILDKQLARGSGKYIAKAIRIYCDRLERGGEINGESKI